MTHKALHWLLPLVLLACGDDSAPGEGESSTGGSASTTGSETSSGTLSTTQSPTGSESSSESGLGSESTSASTSGTSTGASSTEGDTSSSSGSDTEEPGTSSSTGAFACDIVEVVEAAAMGKREPVDCGFVQLADPLDEWEAAHDCVVENYGNEAAFTVVAELQGIDSEIHIGYAGSVGVAYVASQFFSDSFMGITIYGTTPCNIGVVEGCTVAVGELCLECVDAAAPDLVCQE